MFFYPNCTRNHAIIFSIRKIERGQSRYRDRAQNKLEENLTNDFVEKLTNH